MMMDPKFWSVLALGCLAAAALPARGEDPKPAAPAAPAAAAPAPSKSKSPADEPRKGPRIGGEQFVTRTLVDPAQGGIPVCVFSAPEKWRSQSQVVWNYSHISNPVAVSGSVENPANAEAFFLHPPALFFGLRPDPSFYQEGQNFGGLIYARQIRDPLTTLVSLVRQLRANAARLQIVGSRDLPELAKALQVPAGKNQKGIGLRVTYEFQGKPVDEEFYGVFDSVEIPYDGPQGRTFQDNWGLTAVHSFRAPKGTLDGRREVFTAIAKSFRPNPAWQQRLAAIGAFLGEQFNRQLQAGYDMIAAAGQISRQISANNDAMIASIDRRLEAARATAPAPEPGARTATDKFDDYIRGVDTVDDPYYGRSQHAATEKYHWTDGYGSYRNSNDPHYDPRNTESGDWQLMPASR